MNYIIAALIGAGLLTLAQAYVPASVMYKYYAAIEKCEAKLSRDQKCVITAIPEVK